MLSLLSHDAITDIFDTSFQIMVNATTKEWAIMTNNKIVVFS